MVVVISTMIYARSAQVMNEVAFSQMQTSLDGAKEAIELRMHIIKLETEKLASNDQVLYFSQGRLKKEAMNRYLNQLMGHLNQDGGYYKDLFMIDRTGIIVATTMEAAQNIDLSTRKYVLESQRTLQTVTSDVLIARSDQSLIVNTVAPVIAPSGEVLAHVGIAIKAEYFSDVVSNLNRGSQVTYSIIDSENRILAHPDKSLIYKELPSSVVESLLSRNDKIIEKTFSIYDGVTLEFQDYEFIEDNRWHLLATRSEQDMFKESLGLLKYVLYAGSFGILIAIGWGYYMGNKITRPIVTMTETLEHLTISYQRIGEAVGNSIERIRDDVAITADHSTDAVQQVNDEIIMLGTAFGRFKKYIGTLIGFLEIESEKIIDESLRLTHAIDDMTLHTSRFICTLSHDIKTSLTLVKGYAKGLKAGVVDSEETRQLFLDGILNSASDIERITCDILDHAYEAQSTPRVNLSAVSLSEFVEDLRSMSESYARENKRLVKASILTGGFDLSHMTLKIDEIKMKRVWHNILSNAIKYSPQGSDIEIEFSVMSESKKILFKIKDYGIGIRESELGKLQDMFYRVEQNETKGYGLGLFIAKSILESHGSKLCICSTYQEWTEVSFALEYEA
jgi:signal transduction histidine kinase